jgi:3-phosphoshikimate 1-carboxyvinyltransferase
MNLLLEASGDRISGSIAVLGSKSETNRMLLLQALYPEITIENISVSDDSVAMQNALSGCNDVIDISHAGTAMRFLTAYFSICETRTVTLTGSPRMQQRPIQILVDALRQLGAEIEYVRDEGFPPLKITGRKLVKNRVTLDAGVSSQYISALLLIAPKLENGLELTLDGKITSVPYIQMTLGLLAEIGSETSFVGNTITVSPLKKLREPKTITIESDWSSASYFYSIVALSYIGTTITLSAYKNNSLQGDRALAELYKSFGVETTFASNTIILTKTEIAVSHVGFELNHTPDIAQTIAVTCFGLGISCTLSGLHTLKIKETDRLVALKHELEKLGAAVSLTDDSLSLEPARGINPGIAIETYDDHRMAMAFAPLALKVPIVINDAEVVSKSYPAFWDDLQKIGFSTSKL